MFDTYLKLWNLVADGDPIVTSAANLLPALRTGDQPAMLKLSNNPDQQRGAALMDWWAGDGAAQVFERSETALLLERATANWSLADMARNGDDDQACRILCATAARLHRQRPKPLPELVPLDVWFRELEPAAQTHGGILMRSLDASRTLLADPREQVVLHGDLHHDNVLDFGPRGWLAIDPHGLAGERGFDFANIFTNPDLSDPSRPVATQPGRFQSRLNIVAAAAKLERRRLLQWVLAWTGLSAAWFLTDDDPLAEIDLKIAELAAAELDR
ncbi:MULTISPECIES: aminoglycoside phosphotransferase family protein [Mesorhizobium]|uniref:APH(6) family putative aminoglycoside O-phosphotransferase n=1 Tax=Mesorhizobium denitrificans TaxID=2294114 RepID=A0A371X3R2_9HYPH|nr:MULTISPECIES: aminoglycoside phosphotransferase family protein [Mesorhizobium]RFC63877.1 APH(6) family putative aminoglycoside O-phosphotransferase [Mesorhizobium denitrificans]